MFNTLVSAAPDSVMLSDVAIMVPGPTHAFPTTLVGTVFVNAIAHLLVRMTRDITLELEPWCTSVGAAGALGGSPCQDNAGRRLVHVPTVQHGQTEDTVMRRIDLPEAVDASYPKAALTNGTRALGDDIMATGP